MVSSDVNSAQSRAVRTPRGRDSERGFTLAAVIVMITMISVVIAYTVPQQWSKIMERERDRQTIFVMKQVARGIYEFRRKNNAFPTSLDQLEKARDPRFLRGVNGFPVDPATGTTDWLIIPAGQQPPGGTPVAPGNGPSMGFVNNNNNNTASPAGASGAPGTTIPGVPAKDFVGPIGGIRPSRTGKSFLALNGKDSYEEWTYTVTDLEQELQQRQASLTLVR